MIDFNSNCSRVDAVKAAANQIEILSSASSSKPAAQAAPANNPSQKVKSDLQTLDSQVKSGDANAAEVTLSVARKDLETAQTAGQQPSPNRDSRTLNVYA